MRFNLLLFVSLAFSSTGLGQNSLHIDLLYHWEDNTLPPSSLWDNTYNEIWGVAIDGREYGIIGSSNGTHIFDVTDPVNSVMVDFVPGAHQGADIVHRDYHDYNGYLYAVADEGISTLQIMDLSYLPDSVHVVYDSDALLTRSHNIFIDSTNARLYACGVSNSNNTASDLEIYDISDPVNPVEILAHQFLYYHDIYVKDHIAFGNNGFDGMTVVDFSNVNSPMVLGALLNYPDRDYNHAGWADEELDYYYLTDENHGMSIKALDITDYTDIQWVDTFSSGVSAQSVPHNCIVHEDYLYVSYYHDGLYIYDISDRENPFIAGYYDTYTDAGHNSFRGAWGVYPFLPSGNILVSDMQYGFFVFDASDALTSIREKSTAQQFFEVGPNPFNEELYLLATQGLEDDAVVTLVSADGREISSTQMPAGYVGKFEVEIPYDLTPGIYFISITNDRYLQVAKIIKTDR